MVIFIYYCSVAKLCATLMTPWTTAHKSFLSFTMSRNLLKFMSIEVVMPSSHLPKITQPGSWHTERDKRQKPVFHPLPPPAFTKTQALRSHCLSEPKGNGQAVWMFRKVRTEVKEKRKTKLGFRSCFTNEIISCVPCSKWTWEALPVLQEKIV